MIGINLEDLPEGKSVGRQEMSATVRAHCNYTHLGKYSYRIGSEGFLGASHD